MTAIYRQFKLREMPRFNYLLTVLALILGLVIGYFARGWVELRADQPPPGQGGISDRTFFRATAKYCQQRLNEIGNGNFRAGLLLYSQGQQRLFKDNDSDERSIAGEIIQENETESVERALKRFLGINNLECIEAIEYRGGFRAESFVLGNPDQPTTGFIRFTVFSEVLWQIHYWTIDENGDCVRKTKIVAQFPKGTKIYRYDIDDEGNTEPPKEVEKVDASAKKIFEETSNPPGLVPWEGFDREKCCQQVAVEETTEL